MDKRHVFAVLVVLVTAALLAGCDGALATPEATALPVVADASSGAVVAEAVIEPARTEELSLEMGGKVVEVLVAEGDTVQAGDIIARLETEDLDRALASADLNLRQAQLRLEQLQPPPEERDIASAEAAIVDAQAAYNEALKQLTLTEHAQATGDDVRAARYARDEAYRVYQDLMAKRDRGSESIGDSIVARAHDAYLDAEGRYNRTVENAEFQLLQARNAVAQAQRAVEQAQRDLDAVLEEPDALDLKAAQLDIEAAALALEEAQSALEDATLEATFDGTVTTLNIDVGDTVGAGQSVLTLATLDRLQAVTKDLTELDVVRVEIGQDVVVTVDAMSNEEFAGTVSEIALSPGDYRGDVVYAVTVDLSGVDDSRLRWGMTALVEIETE
jgi:multidrug efflux pump subunit AcrA (membrane-fusion protein)